jgi:hypothetical protein
VPLDETVGADVDKVKGGVVSVGAKPQEQIANEANRKLRVDEQPKKDTFAHPSGVSVPREGVTVGTVLVSLGGRWERADGVSAQKQGEVMQVEAATETEKDSRIFLRSYRAHSDDVAWAQCGGVATVANGEAGSVVRRRLKDAGFKDLDLLHLGGDRVLVRSPEGIDVLSVLDQAKDFFHLCFSHWVR